MAGGLPKIVAHWYRYLYPAKSFIFKQVFDLVASTLSASRRIAYSVLCGVRLSYTFTIVLANSDTAG